MKWLFITLFAAVAVAAPLPSWAQGRVKDNKPNKDQEKKSESVLTPEQESWKREFESWPTDRLQQQVAIEKRAIEEWARKNNFDPPGDKYDADRNRVARKKGRLGRVVIGKRQYAELMAQFLPRKARIDIMELVLREREKPRKERAEKKEK